MEVHNRVSPAEEDDDIEALRLAALQSLKKKAQQNNEGPHLGQFSTLKEKPGHFNGSPRGKHKRGKFTRQQQGRQQRNGQFNNGWARNSNLISVPMVSEEENLSESTSAKPVSSEVPKLILPQDRYCKKVGEEDERSDSVTTKFDRYDNSDESESDSDEESTKSEKDENPSELKRSSSLEALMAELENEIQGSGGGEQKSKEESVKQEKVKIVKTKKRRKLSTHAVDPESSKIVENNIETAATKENLQPQTPPKIEHPKKNPMNHQNNQNFSRNRGKWQQGKPRRHNFPPPPPLIHQPPPPEIIAPPIVQFPPAPIQNFPSYPPIGYDNSVYVAPPPMGYEVPPPQLPPMHVAPPIYDRPLSPLVINTDSFSTSGMLAPLSPRSAAFVLENRAIIEKRKRKSYSRSPSPRFRRSKSPRRSSVSPKRLSKSPVLRRRSLSPSPVRKVLPPKTNSPKKSSIHERLGAKFANVNKTERDEDKNKKDVKPKVEDAKPDPVLEARRRKFERNEITMKEGVIRLRAKEEDNDRKNELDEAKDLEEEIDEDALLEGDDTLFLDPKLDTLFSDEESDSDNEGRFKTKQDTNKKVPVLPFTKLINGTKNDVKTDLKLEERRNEKARNARKFRSRSPRDSRKVLRSPAKKTEKAKTTAFPVEKKIEIKIRNPAKYEKIENSDEQSNRKVEVEKSVADDGAFDFESAEESLNASINEGDLRAQLSRKRAERQKQPLPDVVPSRLLQNALQGVCFRKNKKVKNSEKLDETAEGKLPIHMRLGASNVTEPLGGKRSRKHKNKGSLEQVLCFLASFILITIF